MEAEQSHFVIVGRGGPSGVLAIVQGWRFHVALRFTRQALTACDPVVALSRSAVLKVWQLGFGRPHAPANLVIYAGEATPGNVLRLDNRRKVLAVYVTLREFGPVLVKHADMWLPLAILRSSQIKDILGGTSFCMRTLLRRIFITDKVTSEGVLLDLQLPQPRFVRLQLVLGNFIGGGDAQRATWNAKGASGNFAMLDVQKRAEPACAFALAVPSAHIVP